MQQRQSQFALKRNKVINDEVEHLFDAGFIREVHYPKWTSNVVVVQKKNRKWKEYLDYTNLNRLIERIAPL